ncbi:HDOD domain-containing protein [bacterium]|nr:HDOD domain-containing protein [bacterium]
MKELLHSESRVHSFEELSEERRAYWDMLISTRAIPSLYTGQCRGMEHLECSDCHETLRRIQTDPLLSSKILFVANSTRTGRRNPLRNVEKACRQLGQELVLSIVLTYEMENDMREDNQVPKRLLQYIRNHSTLCHVLAGIYTKEISIGEPEAVIQAALLSSVTTLLYAQTSQFDEDTYLSFPDEQQRLLHEEELWGVSSPVIARRMLGTWGLVDPIPELAGRRHEPLLRMLDVDVPMHEQRQLCLIAVINALAHGYIARQSTSPEILLDRRNYTILRKNLIACGLYVAVGRHWGKRSTENILRAAY